MERKNSQTNKNMMLLLTAISGFMGATVAASVLVYNFIFRRFERPDYAIYPGNYTYERLKNFLSREEFFFPSGSVNLKGYYYEAKKSRGLLVLAHGLRSGADDYLPITEFFVKEGYNVFAYDCTGTYDSEGESMVGMCQSLLDIEAALAFITRVSPLHEQPLFLLGHSWGGYAVSSVLALTKNIRACACIAPMNNGYTLFLEKGEQYAGKAAAGISKPILNTYQKILFGNYTEYNGVRGINSTCAPIIIAQGTDDKVITHNGQSITAHKSEITNPNVTYYEPEGAEGEHSNIWHSTDSLIYRNEIAGELKLMQNKRCSSPCRSELVEFYRKINHRRYSEVNIPLMEKIAAIFERS